MTTPPGPGLDPDAMSYLGAAQSLVRDGTLRIPVAPWSSDSATAPLAHFPPGYSAVLAVSIALGADARLAARIIQAAAAGLTTVAVMLLLWPVAGAWGAVLGALAVVISPAFVYVHLSVLSEPLFLALVTLALWSLVRRPRAALLHGVIAAAATMVRYAGLSVAGAAALWALRDTSAPWRDRLKRALYALAPSLLAMAAWSLTRQRAPGAAVSIRKFAIYGNWGPTLRQGAETVSHLLVPSLEWDPVPKIAALGTLAALAAMGWSTTRAWDDTSPEDTSARAMWERAVLAAAALLALCYAGLVVASRALADPDIPFDFRLAVPLVPLAVVAVAVVAARSWRVIATPARVFGVLALAAWMLTAGRTMSAQLEDIASTGGGDFASRDWRESPTLAWARTEGAARNLHANWPCAIWFHLDRRVRALPDTAEAANAATMQKFVQRLRASNGAVIAWKLQSPETANTDTIVARAGLVRVAQFVDGAVFVAPPLVAAPAAPVAPPAAHR
ncbi:MAG: ArnT family glycosyltransferase [Gemmatimonadaceae bacterium]